MKRPSQKGSFPTPLAVARQRKQGKPQHPREHRDRAAQNRYGAGPVPGAIAERGDQVRVELDPMHPANRRRITDPDGMIRYAAIPDLDLFIRISTVVAVSHDRDFDLPLITLADGSRYHARTGRAIYNGVTRLVVDSDRTGARTD